MKHTLTLCSPLGGPFFFKMYPTIFSFFFQRKKRYQENKEKILESQKEMITCECGAHIRKTGKNEHCKSTKHQDYILSKNTIQIL